MTTAASGVVETDTILDKIIARTIADVELRKQQVSIRELEQRIGAMPPTASLRSALQRERLALIAEIKRASPSKGRFPIEFEVDGVAAEYRAAGADALSVLTDEPFFQGSLIDLESAATVAHRADAAIPVLRKDFVVDDYQLLEARAFGADAALLIVGALTDRRLRASMDVAAHLGLETLVEVHDEQEMVRALEAGATLIGINNRDLRTFHVDLGVTERLARLAPETVVLVGESGIFTGDDARRMRAAGMDAVLVGESLILAPDRAAAIRSIEVDDRRGSRN